MIEPARVLQPLDEVGDAVRRLGDYRTAAELAGAVADVGLAVEETLRRLLRADPDTPDSLRLNAFAPEALPFPSVIEALRRQRRIAMETAGRCVELNRAVERGRTGEVRAADADLAFDAVKRLRADVERASAAAREKPESAEMGGAAGTTGRAGMGGTGGVGGVGGVDGTAEKAGKSGAEPAPRAVVPERITPEKSASRKPAPAKADVDRRPRLRSFTVLAAVLAGLILVALVFTLVRSANEDMAAALAAFEAGQFEEAQDRFTLVVENEPDNVTARLYLSRIQRRAGAYDQAAEQLRQAAALQPNDPDVRRELGYLFLELERPAAAAEQFRRALEFEPENVRGWIGLIVALRAAGDPSADEVLQRAPATVRALLTD